MVPNEKMKATAHIPLWLLSLYHIWQYNFQIKCYGSLHPGRLSLMESEVEQTSKGLCKGSCSVKTLFCYNYQIIKAGIIISDIYM